jgi:hypothetical protein
MRKIKGHNNWLVLITGVLGLMLVAQPVYAKGVIKGRVFDKNSKDALSYANVIIKGTALERRRMPTVCTPSIMLRMECKPSWCLT